MQKLLIFVVFVLFLFFLPLSVSAVSVTIVNYPSSITDEPFTITASISGASSGTNYLRIDMFKDTSSNYFGETFNGTDWYSGSAYAQYLPVTIQSGSWSGTIQGRIGSPTSSQYDGMGTYKLRLRRYTSGGGYTASEASNSAVVVAIAVPTATPTPTDVQPTATPTKTPTPIPTKITPSPTKKPSATPTKSIKKNDTKEVLGTQSAEKISVSPTPESKKAAKEQNNGFAGIYLIIAAFLLLACGILIFLKSKKLNE